MRSTARHTLLVLALAVFAGPVAAESGSEVDWFEVEIAACQALGRYAAEQPAEAFETCPVGLQGRCLFNRPRDSVIVVSPDSGGGLAMAYTTGAGLAHCAHCVAGKVAFGLLEPEFYSRNATRLPPPLCSDD